MMKVASGTRSSEKSFLVRVIERAHSSSSRSSAAASAICVQELTQLDPGLSAAQEGGDLSLYFFS